MLHAGAYELLLEEADRHFEAGGGNPAADAWVAVRACQAAGGLRAWGRAVSWADRGRALTQAAGGEGACPEAALLLRFLTGTALMYTGDLLRAGRELAAFRQEAAANPRLARLLGDALYNEAYLHRSLGRRDDEVRLFAEAAQLYTGQGRHRQVAVCRYEMAWSLLLAGHPAEAVPHLEAAETGGVDEDLAADIQIGWALYHHLAGDRKRSESVCELLLLTCDELPHRQRADMVWIMGRNALAVGDRERAGELAAEACQTAVEDWWPPQLERLNAFLLQVRTGTAMLG